jgi:hypothetical protein
MRIVSAMPEEQACALHFASTILKPVFGSLHHYPLPANYGSDILE